MAKELVEGKYYSAPVGLVRQAFADGYLDEGTDFVVGISMDSNMCPTYWFGDGMDVVDTDDALDAIAEGLGLEEESIADIFYLAICIQKYHKPWRLFCRLFHDKRHKGQPLKFCCLFLLLCSICICRMFLYFLQKLPKHHLC